MSVRSFFVLSLIKSFLSLLHRGIPGKKCGTIVLSAEELSNCRVSKPSNHSNIHVSVQNQVLPCIKTEDQRSESETPIVRKVWREHYEFIWGQVALLSFSRPNRWVLTQSGVRSLSKAAEMNCEALEFSHNKSNTLEIFKDDFWLPGILDCKCRLKMLNE